MAKVLQKTKTTFVKIGQFFSGVVKEGKRVRWPSKKAVLDDTSTVILFCAFFAAFFAIALTIVNAVLTALGYIS